MKGGEKMSLRTKAIGAAFIIGTILLAMIVDSLNWSNWLVA